jgi:hypothetical protein
MSRDATRREVCPMTMSIVAPICAICDKIVSLESGKADEDGQIVHEHCYVLKVKQVRNKSERPATTEISDDQEHN